MEADARGSGTGRRAAGDERIGKQHEAEELICPRNEWINDSCDKAARYALMERAAVLI